MRQVEFRFAEFWSGVRPLAQGRQAVSGRTVARPESRIAGKRWPTRQERFPGMPVSRLDRRKSEMPTKWLALSLYARGDFTYGKHSCWILGAFEK